MIDRKFYTQNAMIRLSTSNLEEMTAFMTISKKVGEKDVNGRTLPVFKKKDGEMYIRDEVSIKFETHELIALSEALRGIALNGGIPNGLVKSKENNTWNITFYHQNNDETKIITLSLSVNNDGSKFVKIAIVKDKNSYQFNMKLKPETAYVLLDIAKTMELMYNELVALL